LTIGKKNSNNKNNKTKQQQSKKRKKKKKKGKKEKKRKNFKQARVKEKVNDDLICCQSKKIDTNEVLFLLSPVLWYILMESSKQTFDYYLEEHDQFT
jgi:hypothetical protein